MYDEALDELRRAIDGDRSRLCDALGLQRDGERYLCPVCQADGRRHDTGDLSIEEGFKCHKCGWSGDGLKLIRTVKGGTFPEALNYARSIYGISSGEPIRAPTKSRRDSAGKTIHATLEKAVEALQWGLSQRDGGKWSVTRRDMYRQADGKDYAAVIRYDSSDGRKTYRPIHAVDGGWQSGDPEGQWPLLHLAKVQAAGENETVYIVEGEKAAEAGLKIGLTSTTSAHGAKSPERTNWEPLRGKDVVILPDNDSAGIAYAVAVSKLCKQAQAKSIKIVKIPDLPEKGDLYEYVENGGTKAGIEELAEETEEAEATEATEATEEIPEEEPKGMPLRDQHGGKPEGQPEGQPEAGKQGDPVELARKGVPYALTDLGNAERLIAHFGDEIKWDVPRKCWRLWDGKRWKADNNNLKVLSMAAESARRIRREAAEAPSGRGQGDDLAAEIWKHAMRSESREKLSSCVEVAKSISGVAVSADSWDSDSMLFNCKNGTIDLTTGELKPHSKADMITRLSNIDYDASAACPRWEKFLEDSTGGNAEFIEFLKRAAGYTLTGSTAEEVLFLVYGVTNSGKTTFLETLKSVLGEYSMTIDPAMLCKSKFGGSTGGNATPELARLDGIRLAGGSEMEQGRELAEAIVKNITGGETITARHLYSDIFQYVPKFKLWLALNHCPRASADDAALWRRMLRIGFDKSVPIGKRDKTLKPYLQRQGAAAVLAWAVKGCIRWQAEGLGVPACVQASTEAYRNESDPLANYFEDCIRIDSGAWTANAEMQESYAEYCEDNGIKFKVSPKRIGEKLKSLGCRADKRGGVRGWQGCEVRLWGGDDPKSDTAETENLRGVDRLDRLDRTFKTFPYEDSLGKSFNISVQSVQSVQIDQKAPIFDSFQNLENRCETYETILDDSFLEEEAQGQAEGTAPGTAPGTAEEIPEDDPQDPLRVIAQGVKQGVNLAPNLAPKPEVKPEAQAPEAEPEITIAAIVDFVDVEEKERLDKLENLLCLEAFRDPELKGFWDYPNGTNYDVL